MNALVRRHGHVDVPANAYTVHHWGYSDEVLPCKQDQNTCEYLAGVYHMHDVSMKYSFIMWGTLLGIACVWVLIRTWQLIGPKRPRGSILDRVCLRVERIRRRWLLQDSPLKVIFGRTTRLQVMILAIMLGYLLIFSFTGILWKRWNPAHPQTSKTRTALGWWSNRVGILAFALTPLTVLLSTRENLLTILTGIPYQHFNFLHRWTGRIIFAQAVLHTIGWTVVELHFYKPSPKNYVALLSQLYGIFGCVATLLIFFLTVFSLKPVIKRTGYEFFKITHWIGAVLYIGACWGHWDKLYCWMVASLSLIVLDQTLRIFRTCYLHFGCTTGSIGFRRAMADVQVIGEGDDVVVRLDFDFEQAWKLGQHFYLCFPSLSIWQSHPFTVASTPDPNSKLQHHTYMLRARKGQTAQLAAFAGQGPMATILTGPYGPDATSKSCAANVLTVAGGTGVTFTLPITIAALRQAVLPHPTVHFVWIMRHAQDLLWLRAEVAGLQELLHANPGLQVDFFVTREVMGSPSASCEVPPPSAISEKDSEKGFVVNVSPASSSITEHGMLQSLTTFSHERFVVNYLGRHPSMSEVVNSFVEKAKERGGEIQVFGSGPEPMGSDLRDALAKVKEEEGLRFYWDSRE